MKTTPFHCFGNSIKIPDSASERALEWERIGEDLWLRPACGEVEIVWCYLGQGTLGERLVHPRLQKSAAKKLGKALSAKRFWRFRSFSEGELFLRRGFGLIRLSEKPFLTRFNFRGAFKNGGDVLYASPQRLENIGHELEQQADFRQSLRWLQDHEDEWSNVYFERGSRQQLELLLRGFWAIFRPPDSQYREWVYTLFTSKAGTFFWYWPYASFGGDERGQAATRRLLEMVNEAVVVKMVPRTAYDSKGSPTYLPRPRVHAPWPSQHDRMEALLLWREFLRDKLPPEEIEALLDRR